jgi:hypothetical protein
VEAPERIEPRTLADYLEVMSRAVFQPGMSWQVVAAKWPGIKQALHDFDPPTLADLTPPALDALMQDRRLIRNRRKLEAIVANAGEMLDLERAHRSFRTYLRSVGGFDATAAELRKRFRFLGEMGAYYFLYVVGEEVPPYHQWCAERHGHGKARRAPRAPATRLRPSRR